ncbi:hypothetical protein PIB30_029077 [Stylosanthes scabra]|uniref:Uncharacterized protein n=1 Tax=Stylosanthes scabra TaxID=79078 RepID=A0ABU6SBM6_9FABA|nr:hypothetical protein [Stylosanthes scabra]
MKATLGGDWQHMEASFETWFGALESLQGVDYNAKFLLFSCGPPSALIVTEAPPHATLVNPLPKRPHSALAIHYSVSCHPKLRWLLCLTELSKGTTMKPLLHYR